MDQKNYICFIIPPHLESQDSKDVSEEVRRRRTGARIMKRSIFRSRVKQYLDDQDIFSAKHSMRIPGWKMADTQAQADRNRNKDVDVCWDNTQEIIKFYMDVLKFDLKSELDGQVVSTINFGKNYNNAFFNGDQMVYGNGDLTHFHMFCHDKTVVCHELGHAIVDSTVPLIYQGMSGALNESYADVFAICFVHHKKNKPFEQLTAQDWMIGEKCVVGDGALRSFTNTLARPDTNSLGPDTDPRSMSDFYSGDEDNGGVHINSSIINHAFYQICKLTGGNTWDKPLKLWYTILAEKLIEPNCTFQEFVRAAVTRAAPFGDNFQNIVEEGFKIVGL